MKLNHVVLLVGLVASLPFTVAGAFEAGPQDMPSILPIDTRCSLSVSAPVIDYGSQSRWQLQDAGGAQMLTPGQRSLMVSVVCPYTQTLRLSLLGDRAANGDVRYGKHGSVNLHIVDAQVDGQSVPVATLTPQGTVEGAPSANLRLQPGQNFAAAKNGKLVKGRSFNARIEIEPVMPQRDAQVTSRQTNESLITLELMD